MPGRAIFAHQRRQEVSPGWRAAAAGRTDGRTAGCVSAADPRGCQPISQLCRAAFPAVPDPGLPSDPGLHHILRCRRIPGCHRRDAAARPGCSGAASSRLWLRPRCPCPSLLLQRVDLTPSLEHFSLPGLYFSLFAAWGQSHTGCAGSREMPLPRGLSSWSRFWTGDNTPYPLTDIVTSFWGRKELPS